MRRPTHGGNLAWAAALAGCSPSLILDFSASINPLGPPKSAIAAIEQALNVLCSYPDPHYNQLRAYLCQLHPTLTPEWILPGNGSAELLTWAARELSELEETCLLTPAFSDYQRALKAFGAKVREYPLELQVGRCKVGLQVGRLEKLGLQVGRLQEGLQEGLQVVRLQVESLKNNLQPSNLQPSNLQPSNLQPSNLQPSTLQPSTLQPSTLGLLLNNPHNPSGALFNRETILPLLSQFALVVVDEAFMDFLPPNQQQSLISVVQDYPNLVIVRSLTKFYSLPGLRLGYCIAHPDRLRRWQQWRDPWPVNALAAAAAIAVVQDTAFQQQTWEWLPKARSQLFQGLASLPGLQPYPSAANFLLVQSEQPSSQVQERLLKTSQILIRDCLSFPELGDRFFRVAVRTEADNQRLLDGLNAVL